MAVVIGVHHDDQPGQIKFFMAVLGDTWFPVPDDSLHEEHGWQRVSMSERTWQSYVMRHSARTRTDVWTGLPLPLNDDGTLKARP
jgi:hypothetical protein